MENISNFQIFKFPTSYLTFAVVVTREELWESEVGKKSDFPTFRHNLAVVTGPIQSGIVERKHICPSTQGSVTSDQKED